MATYIKVSSGWKARVRMHGQPNRSKTFKCKADASAWASEIERDIRKGQTIPDRKAGTFTLSEAVDRYIKSTLPNKARNKDAAGLISRLEWWQKQAGKYALLQITPAVVAEYRDLLVEKKNRYGIPISAQTIKTI